MSHGHPWKSRGYQWFHVKQNVLSPSADFGLRSLFDVPRTNDIVIEITPLLYRVDDKVQKARLVEFAPIKLRLLPDRDIERLN